MTVSSTVSRWDYLGNGSLDTYQYACEIYLKTDLKVYVSGVLKTVDTHYTISPTGINNPDGGNIVFYSDYIPANLAPVAIILDLPLTQLTDYKEGDKFPAETHEKALDRLVKIAQAFNNVLGRVLKVPIWSTLSNILVEIDAGKYLRWNAGGTSIICDSGTTVGAHGESHENGNADEVSVTGLSGLLADDQHVLDAEVKLIKLDDFAAPDDNTDLDVSAAKHGLCPKGGYIGGHVVQVVNTQTGAVATGTTSIPKDDTIPQITEGTEFMTLAITPKLATNKLKIDIICVVSPSVGGNVTVALFQDTTANGLAAVAEYVGTGDLDPIHLIHYMTTGTTSSTTFRIRAGGTAGETITFNGIAAGRIFGGVMASSITITEIAV